MLKCDFVARITGTLTTKNRPFFHLDNKEIQMESEINNSPSLFILSLREKANSF